MNNLCIKRRLCGACVFNQRHIYAICGYNNDKGMLNSIEKVSLEIGSRWAMVNVTNNDIMVEGSLVQAAQVGHGRVWQFSYILLFGYTPK